jgi:hypothetical protein
MLVFPLVFTAACAGWAPTDERADHSTVAPSQEAISSPERVPSQNVKAAAPLPSEDVPGRDVPDLPRYPGSVRVEYERRQHDALVLTRTRYLSAENRDTVRGFYRGVFRSEGWRVANAEFSDGEWNFLAVKGEREVDIEVRSHRGGAETDVRVSAPLPPRQPEKNTSSEARTSKPDASRETAPSRAPEPPVPTAPASPPPATASGGYGYEDDGWDEYEDD